MKKDTIEVIAEMNKLTSAMERLSAATQKNYPTLKIVNMQSQALIGLNELFLPKQFTTRKYGATVNSQSLIMLRYTVGNRLQREWRKLFKSKDFR
jgi:hypothetical protein